MRLNYPLFVESKDFCEGHTRLKIKKINKVSPVIKNIINCQQLNKLDEWAMSPSKYLRLI
jgi:hypothetical protein